MDVAAPIFASVLGLVLGSFLNVVAARVPLHESIVRPGSRCPNCGHAIAWYDNIPLVSYLVLRARCRSCGAAISPRYPAVELAMGLLAAACVWKFGLEAKALLAILFCALLVAISAIDFEHRIVPNVIVLPSTAFVLAARTALDPSFEWALSALAAAGLLLLIALIYPAGMGLGDVKLALLLGAMLGRTVAVAVAAGMIAAMAPAIWLLIRHGRSARKMTIAFAPFLAIGGLLALFTGSSLLDAYLSLF